MVAATPEAPGSSRHHFETTDPEAGSEYLSRAYGTGVDMKGRTRRYLLRHTRRGPGPFYIDRLTHSVTADVEASPSERIVIARPERGWVKVARDGDVEHYRAGDVFVTTQPDEPYSFSYRADDPSTFTVLSIDQAAAAAACGNGDEAGPLRFGSLTPLSPAAARHLTATISYVNDHVLANDHVGGHPLVVGGATRLVISAALAAFPNSWTLEPSRPERADVGPSVLARAVEFTEANADVDITVFDIGRAAAVSARAVQLAFRRHLDTTPTGYLRQVRLERAHRDLALSDPAEGRTVTDIALRWGFQDPDRFAELYRRRYGTTPVSRLTVTQDDR